MIHAEAHSDDRIIEVEFDAEPYFAQATDHQLRALIACGFGGDYAADRLAEGLADEVDGLADLFKYLELVNKPGRRRETVGFECHADPAAAAAWIKANRPVLAHLLDD